MRYQILLDNPEPLLQTQLEAFEAQFQYPLGEKLKFTISHGAKYLNFYQSMGKAFAVIAEDIKGVQGTLCASMRRLYSPQNSKGRKVYYTGDFRVSPCFQKGRVSYHLIKRFIERVISSHAACLAVVMDGTAVTPLHYTGRVGIPHLEPLHKLYIVQLKARNMRNETEVEEIPGKEGKRCFAALTKHAYFEPKKISLRAKNPQRWLHYGHKACGLFENTLLAKRLFLNSGQEIKNAHLSFFAFDEVCSAMNLINAALTLCHRYGYQGLFFALLPEQYAMLKDSLLPYEGYHVSTATVYGSEEMKNQSISINSAEI